MGRCKRDDQIAAWARDSVFTRQQSSTLTGLISESGAEHYTDDRGAHWLKMPTSRGDLWLRPDGDGFFWGLRKKETA